MMFNLTFAGLTDKGRLRDSNEDAWFADRQQGLFIVSDGMGGHAAGEVASGIVVQALPPLIQQRLQGLPPSSSPDIADVLVSAIRDLSEQVLEESRNHPALDGMGATIVLCLVQDRQAVIGHLGDSRAYLLRRHELHRLTRDHSIVQILIDAGEIREEEAPTHPARGKITRAVGMPGLALPDTKVLNLAAGDRLLLCCDGLTDMLTDDQIARILRTSDTPEVACRYLVEAANRAGGRDNITTVVMDWNGPRGNGTGTAGS
jgi:protein phosphatase